MIKVAYIVPLLAPYADIRYQKLGKLNEIEVHVIAERSTSNERTGWKYHEIPGVYTHLLPNTVGKKFSISNDRDGYSVQKEHVYPMGLKKVLKDINPDIVLACNTTELLGLIGPRKYKLGVIVEDTLRAAEGRSKKNAAIKRLMLKTADFYCPFSEDAEQFLIANGIHGPFIRSSWSMDIDFFTDMSAEEKNSFCDEHGLNQDKTNYILVANLIPRKGIMQFLSGWSAMSDVFKRQSELFILGSGVLEPRVREFLQENNIGNAHLLGSIPYKEVSHYLQCGDVFVLPTLEDLCSLSVLEAMAAGKPVITTIYNGARQFVEEGVNGFIYDPLSHKGTENVLNAMFYADIGKLSIESSRLILKYSTEEVMGKFGKELLALC